MRVADCVDRARFAVLLVWLVAAAVGGWRSALFFGATADVERPSDSAPSVRALTLCSHYNLGVPAWTAPMPTLVLATRREHSKYASIGDNPAVLEALQRASADPSLCGGQATVTGVPLAQSIVWARNVSSVADSEFVEAFVGRDGASTLLVLRCSAFLVDAIDEYESAVSSRHSGGLGPEGVRVVATSIERIQETESDATTASLGRMDSVAIPLALLLLGVSVGAVQLLFVPVACLVTVVAVSLGVLDALATTVTFPSFSPALFISLATATVFDWNLFLLRRFSEAVRDRCRQSHPNRLTRLDAVDAVAEMLATSGHVVLFAGLTLTVAVLTFLALPLGMLRSIGLGLAVVVAVSMLVNLTLPAALLLSLPQLAMWWTRRQERKRQRDVGTETTTQPLLATSSLQLQSPPSPAPPLSVSSGDGGGGGGRGWAQWQQRSVRRFFELVVDHPLVVLLALAVVLGPIVAFVGQFSVSANMNEQQPRNVVYTKRYREIVRNFDGSPLLGSTLSFVVLWIPPAGVNATSAVGVATVERLLQTVAVRTGVGTELMQGPTFVDNSTVAPATIDRMVAELAVNGTDYSPAARYYFARTFGCWPEITPFGYGTITNDTGASNAWQLPLVATRVDVPFDPQGQRANDFVRAARSALQEFGDNGGAGEVALAGGGDMMFNFDIALDVYARFYWVLCMAVVLLSGVLSLVYRSPLAGLRMAVTVAVVLSVALSTTVLVFDKALASHEIRPHWLGPVLVLVLAVGLSIDYDIFVVSRVRELRVAGYSVRESIVDGLTRSAGVVTTAGVIMVVSFGVLMLSPQMILVQAGFMLTTAILLDAFVVRTILVPAMLSLSGDAHWWPAQMPAAATK